MKQYLKIHGVEYGVVEKLSLFTDNGREYKVYINEDFDDIPDCPDNEAFDIFDFTNGGEDPIPNWFSIAVEPKPEDRDEYPELHNLEFIFDWEDKEPVHVNYVTEEGIILHADTFDVEF